MSSPRRVGLTGHPDPVYAQDGPGHGDSAVPRSPDDGRIRASAGMTPSLRDGLILDA